MAPQITPRFLEDQNWWEGRRHLLNDLKRTPRQVVTLYYCLEGGEPKTHRQIGRYFEVSYQRIGQIIRDARSEVERSETAHASTTAD